MSASQSLTTGLIYSGIPTAVALAGTAVATIWQPSKWVRSAILHLSAGIAVSVVAVELLPRILRTHHGLPWIAGGFVLGLLVMLATRWIEHHTDSQNGGPSSEMAAESDGQKQPGWPIGLLAGAGIDQVIDGVLLGIGITVGQSLGALLSLSMTVEDLTLAVAVVTMLASAGAARWQSIGTSAVLGLLLIGVTMLGVLVLGGLSAQIVAGLLSFASAALLYVVMEQLIVEAHEAAAGPWLASTFFAGFLLIFILSILTA